MARPILLLTACALSLSACSGSELSRTFGMSRDAPDEFVVTTRAPLSMPPDFNLRAPRPGAERPQELSQEEQAKAALVPQGLLEQEPSAEAQTSVGQQALVAAAGPAAPAGIRAEVNREAALDAPGRSFSDRLMFWRPPPAPGTQVDPKREAARLRQNAALGQSVETGDTPIIQRKRQGLFSLF